MKAYTTYIGNISGYQDVSATVKATEKIAASSLVKIYENISILEEYLKSLEIVIAKFNKFYGLKSSLLAKQAARGKTLVVLMGNKGLCGDLYPSILQLTFSQANYREVILVGMAGEQYLTEAGFRVETKFDNPFKPEFDEEVFNNIFEYIFQKFVGDNLEIDILYAEPLTLTKSVPKLSSFLPLSLSALEIEYKPEAVSGGFPILASSVSNATDILIKTKISADLYSILLKAAISELSSRTISMEHAETKTEEFISKLKLNYFKERRLAVTQTQLESFTAHKRL